jgi:hypothetical protein
MARNIKILAQRRKTIDGLDDLPPLIVPDLYRTRGGFRFVMPPKGYGLRLQGERPTRPARRSARRTRRSAPRKNLG